MSHYDIIVQIWSINLIAKTSPITTSEITPGLYTHLNRDQM